MSCGCGVVEELAAACGFLVVGDGVIHHNVTVLLFFLAGTGMAQKIPDFFSAEKKLRFYTPEVTKALRIREIVSATVPLKEEELARDRFCFYLISFYSSRGRPAITRNLYQGFMIHGPFPLDYPNSRTRGVG